MKKHLLLSWLLVAALLISGCGNQRNSTEQASNVSTQVDSSDIFSNRDYEVGYDESESAIITLNGDSAECNSNAVQINGSTVTIIDEGTYILSGTLNDGMIIVNSEKTDKTQLVLNGVTIHSDTSAPIYILQSDKVFITMAPDSVNTLSNGGTFTSIDENNIDAVIFSKEDVTLNGSGTLTITSPAGHGIVSKDSLTITSGTYDISSASHGLAGKDDVSIANAAFTITSGKDGIHAENADDASKGFVYIESGTFEISAEGDGISASANMQIQGGSFDITTGGGSVNAAKQTSDSWGGFGGRHPGENRGGGSRGGTTSTDTEEDSTSIKGIKAATDLVINGGTFTIDSADDAVHSNTNITVGGGTFDIASGDDAFHADETLTITSGTINITESYEGLEGLHIDISGGDITLVASDDGLNAAGGTDQSGFGGMRGNDQFGGGRPNGKGGMGSGNSSGSITISGGTIHVTASGDGIDANGTLTISGGFTTVCGPTKGDTATLDYDVSAVITGGTFIGTGASGMSYVDERFVDEAENKDYPKRVVSPWIKVASMAACLCLIIFSLYNLHPYLRGETEGITGEGAADAMPEGVLEDEKDQISQESAIENPAEEGAPRAPETMIRILKLTETGFVGTVHDNGGFNVFEHGTEITVTVDLETDPNFKPEDYQIGDLVHVMYTEWDVDERTMVASILGIVDEPIYD